MTATVIYPVIHEFFRVVELVWTVEQEISESLLNHRSSTELLYFVLLE